MNTQNTIIDKSYKFALTTARTVGSSSGRKGIYFPVYSQLLRAATSVGANIREAHNAFSRKEFAYKMHVAQKECAESMYWLELIRDLELLAEDDFRKLHSNANEILKILKSIILSTKAKI